MSDNQDRVGKHTPGPWRWTSVDYGPGCFDGTYQEGGPFDALWSDATGKPVFVTQDASSYIGICDFLNDNDPHLIAAAPDLLEALEAAVECGMVPKSSAQDGGAVRHSRQARVADMIRAAIAKAKGLDQ